MPKIEVSYILHYLNAAVGLRPMSTKPKMMLVAMRSVDPDFPDHGHLSIVSEHNVGRRQLQELYAEPQLPPVNMEMKM